MKKRFLVVVLILGFIFSFMPVFPKKMKELEKEERQVASETIDFGKYSQKVVKENGEIVYVLSEEGQKAALKEAYQEKYPNFEGEIQIQDVKTENGMEKTAKRESLMAKLMAWFK